jgi:ATP-dependent DNA helicase RecQ
LTSRVGRTDIDQLARERFGFEALRPGQREGVEAVVAGRDALCVMATGSGKSAIYQLAGLIIDGPTIVVSPLIALQRDQVEAAEEEGIAEAELINSTLTSRQRARAFEEAAAGGVEFVLLAPEQLANPEVLERLRAARPSLFVVDEAHCVSQWGHDFRPDYLRLPAAIEAVGRPAVLALTATAAPPVREEIVEVLGLRDPAIIVKGFDRPNIHLAVHTFHDAEHKRRALLDAVAAEEPPGIVYAATKLGAEEVAAELAARGVRAAAYHGGMGARRRDEVQEAFMEDAGVDVVVATTAFVFHQDVSESVDAYYQELGRAGRDGAPARACLFWRPEDLGLRRFFAGGLVDRAAMERVARLLVAVGRPVDPARMLEDAGMSKTKLATAIHRLQEAGFVEERDDGTVRATAGGDALEEAVEIAAEAEEARHAFDRSRVDMIRAYAERRGCRRAFILGYFGEDYDPPCGNCDNCDAGLTEDDGGGAADGLGFEVGTRVSHVRWGAGMIAQVEGGHITVVFDDVGYKTLGAALVAERGLLEPLAD